MGLKIDRTKVGVVLVALVAGFGAATAQASSASSPVPQAGNWEGTGPHGLPLSFSLAHRKGRLVATSIALGAPFTCPANERDAEAVPLSGVAYAGPGGALAHAGGAAVLSGRVPLRAETARITGQFATPSSGTFSLEVTKNVGCGWPTPALTWQVHRAPRERIADGAWTAPLTGPGIITGSVNVLVAGRGRVLESFHSSFECESATLSGEGGFTTSPAYEFIRPNGSFYSPLNGDLDHGHRTMWGGWWGSSGGFSGTLRIYDPCTRKVVRAHFRR